MSLATMTNMAYTTWEPGLNSQLESEDGSLYSFISRSSKDVRGKAILIKLKSGRSTGISVLAEGGDYPAAGDPTYSEVQMALSRVAGTVEWTQDEMDLLDGSDAAAVPVVEEKLSDLVATLRRDIIRQSWMDGSAKLARLASNGSLNTLALQTSGTSQIDRDRFNWLEPNGMRIDIVNGTTGAATVTNRLVTDISETNNTITISGAATTTATTDVVVRSGNSTAAAGAYVSREFPGILAAVATGNTYLTLDRTAAGNAYWQSNVITGASAGTAEALTIDRVMKLINKVTKKTGQMASSANYCFFSNLGVWAAYGELLQPAQRYQAGQTLDFGWPKLDIFGMALYGDIHAPHNNLFLLHHPSFSYRRPAYETRGVFQWQDKDGSVFRYKTGATAGNYASAIQSFMSGLLTLITERPNRHGRLDDVIEAG
jgi:hypothetical protein